MVGGRRDGCPGGRDGVRSGAGAALPEPIRISRRLSRRVGRLRFSPPVSHVYHPAVYAREPHELYLRRYARPGCRTLLLGMNPGPFGMAQTGVPFGEIEAVREWLRIEGPVRRPRREHPKRPVEGFACRRSEVSGRRLWGLARRHFGTPERFFRHFFVWNYCPLAFLEAGGRNRTPDRLPPAEREPLFRACDRALVELVRFLRPERVIGVGRFAAVRAARAVGGEVAVGELLHPSPASPRANRGWEEQALAQLRAQGALPPSRQPDLSPKARS